MGNDELAKKTILELAALPWEKLIKIKEHRWCKECCTSQLSSNWINDTCPECGHIQTEEEYPSD